MTDLTREWATVAAAMIGARRHPQPWEAANDKTKPHKPGKDRAKVKAARKQRRRMK